MKTKVFLAYVKSAMHAICVLLVTSTGLLVVPVAILCMKKGDTNLPKWAWWWGNDKDGDSDEGWRTEHYPNGTHARFWPRFVWFAIRNSAFNFSIRYGAVILEGRKFTLVESGDPNTSNRDSAFNGAGHSGISRRCLVFDDGQVVPMFYLVRQWGSTGRCLRVLIGWKLMGKNVEKSYVEPVFNANPFMGFEKTDAHKP